jgi:hypothetical protein
MADEPKEKPAPTSADVVKDDSGKKLREAQEHAAGLEKKLQDLSTEKAAQEKIIAELTRIPAQVPEKHKDLLDEICDFLGIKV